MLQQIFVKGLHAAFVVCAVRVAAMSTYNPTLDLNEAVWCVDGASGMGLFCYNAGTPRLYFGNISGATWYSCFVPITLGQWYVVLTRLLNSTTLQIWAYAQDGSYATQSVATASGTARLDAGTIKIGATLPSAKIGLLVFLY